MSLWNSHPRHWRTSLSQRFGYALLGALLILAMLRMLGYLLT